MNGLTEKLMSEYNPTLALVVYQHTIRTSEQQYYIESHCIDENGALMAARPLQQDTLQGIVDVFYNSHNTSSDISGPIPGNLLYFSKMPGSKYKMAWWVSEMKQHLFFTTETKIKSGYAWIPPTLFVVNDNRLFVYAMKKNERPSPKTPIMIAPYYNLSDSGLMCLGNAVVKKPAVKTFENTMQYWMDLFFLSEFSHESGTDNKVEGGNLDQVWKDLLKNKKKRFDSNLLLPYKRNKKNVTLNQVIE
jgi:PRTRC genetic system protein B